MYDKYLDFIIGQNDKKFFVLVLQYTTTPNPIVCLFFFSLNALHFSGFALLHFAKAK